MNKLLVKIIEDSLKSINFKERFEALLFEHKDFSNRLTKVSNSELNSALKNMGYKFKIFNPGQEFYLEEYFQKTKLRLSFYKKNGVVSFFINIYINDNKIDFESNYAFIYKYLINNRELLLDPMAFSTIEELLKIIEESLLLYEDFKTEFLKQVAQTEET